MRHNYDIVIVGGGASGILAAIFARRNGATVLLCEKMPRLGKKILASGSGRCNLLNDKIDASFYNPEACKIADSVLAQFTKQKALEFFKYLGLVVYSDEGRIFPVTNQAQSVLEVLEIELSSLGVDVRCLSQVHSISAAPVGFTLRLNPGERILSGKLILCCGGRSYPALGADGSGYALAAGFGHTIIDPVPSAVPLLTHDPFCHLLQGLKISVSVYSLIHDKTGRKVKGDLLFTKYGLSGTAILDISEEISIAINRLGGKDVEIIVDLLPFLTEEELIKELTIRLERKFPNDRLLAGLLPHKLSAVFLGFFKTRDAAMIAKQLKNKKFVIYGTRGWNEAEFTSGGVDTSEVNSRSLESKLCPGLYFAGEVLNVQGRRGGYNLAWAWASGFVAGSSAAQVAKNHMEG